MPLNKKIESLTGKNVRIIIKHGNIYKGQLNYNNNSISISGNLVDINEIERINEIPEFELNKKLIITKNKEKISKTFNEATAFIRLIDGKEYKNNDLISEIPLAVNCAFACELYLKVLLLNRGYTVDDVIYLNHNLKKLYYNLEEKDKENISIWIKTFTQNDVLNLLDEIKNVFSDLRYNFITEKVKCIDMEKLLEFTFKIQNYTSFEIVGYDIYRFPNGKPTKKEEDEYLDNLVKEKFTTNKK